MGPKHSYFVAAIAFVAVAAMGIGCGGSKSVADDDGSTETGNQFEPVEFTAYRDFIERIAPPVFVALATAPNDSSIWNEGDFPLLGKVFGIDEPMSLYANIDNLDLIVADIEGLLIQDSLGNIMSDTAAVAASGSTVQISQLANGVAIPTAYQEVIGMLRADVDYVVTVTWAGATTKESQLGFTSTDSTQTVLSWNRFTQAGSNEVSTFLFYADANRVDSSIEMRGLFYKDYGDTTTARWVYHIESAESDEFSYRMSWYSDDFGGQSAVASIVGGGDKATEFALRYRQYTPPTSQAPDPLYELDQTFGPNFTFGDTTIAASFNDYVNENLIFRYSAFPQSEIVSPWAVSK